MFKVNWLDNIELKERQSNLGVFSPLKLNPSAKKICFF